ncbi:MAG: TonB-dependent receptor [Novosphingobium sp.]
MAQESSDAPAKEKDSDIIVTGTLIRGKAPVGSNAITLGANRIQEVGAQSGNDLLASVPQVTNYFNKLPVSDLAIEVSQLNIARPNLRNISPNSAASSATLVLVDGHRVATAGVNQASVDPDLIPIGAIERVDVVTEGGSATYGTDAVAGVINYITRRRFEGVEVGGHFGFADNYKQWDVKATVGKTWDTGSAWLSYSYAQSDALFGRDRAYHRNVDYATLPYVGRDIQCPTPNVSYGAFAPLANRIFNGGTIPNPALTCDNSENASFVPRAERHGGMIGLSQDIGDKTSIDVRAYYSQRDTLAVGDLASPVAVGGNNAYASQLPAGIPSTFVVGQPVVLFGFLPAVNQVQVNFNLRPLLGDGSQRSTTTIKQWGANAEFRHDLTEDWQIKGLVNWGQSDSSYHAGQISPARLVQAGAPPVGATTANSFNPFNVTANNAALIADLIDSQRFGQAKNELFNVRAIAEGKLFELPGGDVRMAVGAEYIHETLQKRASTDVRASGVAALPFSTYKRHVESLFAEVQAPLFLNGEGDPMLTVSGAVRYDHYSDFGNTTNPKFGATFKPVHWLTLRGNWGTSFTAPTPLDQLGSLANFTSFNTFVAFSRPGETALPNSGTAAIQGSLAGLQPQTATTWSIGADIQPVDGLRLSANYYSVHFKNILRTPFSNTPFTDFPANYQTKVTGFTPAEVAAFFGSTPGAAATIATIGNSTVYELVDFRTGNLGVLKVKGIDASLDYTHQTGFGSVDLSVNANRPLSRKAQVSPSSAIVDELLVENSKLALRVALGAKVGALRAQATVNHSAGYNITPITGIAVPQSRVGSFTVVNLFFKYDVPGDSMLLKDLSFTLNVDNLFDKDPPVLRRNNNNENGFANGFTLGRLINIGINKKF